MNSQKHSLRALFEKWLGGPGDQATRVIRLCRSRSGGVRFVCVQAERSSDAVTLFFFQHENGNWHVFPPAAALPAIRIGRVFQ